jgi:hypothetical protein
MSVTTDDLVLDSLRRRMRGMHSLYADALATMGPEHVTGCATWVRSSWPGASSAWAA